MFNKASLQRSANLTIKAKSFFDYKTEYYSQLKHSSKELLLNYFGATENDWESWTWQLKNRITNAEQLKELFDIPQYEYEQIRKVGNKFRFAITPYYLSLIKSFNTNDPVYLQSIPQSEELYDIGEADPMNELNNNPAGAITRRYPDRVIVNVTNSCAAFCRHCQRRRNIGEFDNHKSASCLEESYEYIKKHPEIRDVLITGGDSLTLSDSAIDDILFKLRSIKTVEIIRIGTRTPVTMPQRITDRLINIFKKHSPIYVNTQFNHPVEITTESARACLNLADSGVVLGNQMVFLKDVNANYYNLQLLNQLLLKIKVRPYYIFHPKKVIGTHHFSISIEEGIKIYEQLRGNTSGLAIPTYILNADQGLGKIVLNKEILQLADVKGFITLKTWEGNKTTINIRSIR
ncbi:MAG: KamA family radical SAM protein [Ruminococcus sp.]|nr:KamA family radical SAM protein [Ruminococcus sp.]